MREIIDHVLQDTQLVKDYYTIPKRAGFIITEEERETILSLKKEADELREKYASSLNEFFSVLEQEPTEEEERKALEQAEKAQEEYEESDSYKRVSEISRELKSIVDGATERLANTYREKDTLYREALELVDTFSLTLEPEKQASFNIPYVPLPSREDKGLNCSVNVDFSKQEKRTRGNLCFSFFISNLDLQNLLAVAELKGWDNKVIVEAVEKKTVEALRVYGQEENITEDQLQIDVSNPFIRGRNPRTPKGKNPGPAEEKSGVSLNLLYNGFGFSFPTSPTDTFITDTLIDVKNAKYLEAVKHKTSHKKYEIQVEKSKIGNKRRITQITDNSEITIELDNCLGDNKNAIKFFDFIRIKANEQALYNGILTRSQVTFSLKELVDVGLFNNTRSARRGFTDAMETLQTLTVQASVKSNKKKEPGKWARAVWFPTSSINGGVCSVSLNQDIKNWRIMAQFYTELPSYTFTLSDRAYLLAKYIFELAREKQNLKSISESGYFNLSLLAVHGKLRLPEETKTKNPKRDIKDEIERVIEEINSTHKEFYGAGELEIIPQYDKEAPINEYLSQGYIQIVLKGKTAEIFNKLSEKKKALIEKNIEKKERIEESARAIYRAKELEKESGEKE